MRSSTWQYKSSSTLLIPASKEGLESTNKDVTGSISEQYCMVPVARRTRNVACNLFQIRNNISNARPYVRHTSPYIISKSDECYTLISFVKCIYFVQTRADDTQRKHGVLVERVCHSLLLVSMTVIGKPLHSRGFWTDEGG